jgi:hypothetical protein
MTTANKELIFYGVAMLAALANEIATLYGVQALTLLPILLVVWFITVRLFELK